MLGWIRLYHAELGILARVALAMIFGAVVGLEREARDKPAGLRTHMLTAAAAALLVSLDSVIVIAYGADLGMQLIQTEPLRIIAAVITGVSCLGTGTILRRSEEHQVEGLTTAASLLVSATVGMCVALSKWVLAVGVTILVLLTLRGVGFLRRWLGGH
jgi:putative Mg2+ transporter-C (MgtC) family protein